MSTPRRVLFTRWTEFDGGAECAAAFAADGGVTSGPAATVVPERIGALGADQLVPAIAAQQAAHGKLGDVAGTLVAGVMCPTQPVRAAAA